MIFWTLGQKEKLFHAFFFLLFVTLYLHYSFTILTGNKFLPSQNMIMLVNGFHFF